MRNFVKFDENSKNVVFVEKVQTCPFRENFHEHPLNVSVFTKIVVIFKFSRTYALKLFTFTFSRTESLSWTG